MSLPTLSDAQNASVIRIDISSNVFYSHHQLFGEHISATFGIDDSLGEFECPPVPPAFEAFWRGIPHHPVNYWGNCGAEYHGWYSIFQIDTFKLEILNIVSGSPYFTLKWSDTSYLKSRCDSMFLVEVSGAIPPIDMFKQDSLFIPYRDQWLGYVFWIYKYGSRLQDFVTINGVKENQPLHSFVLHQNYPNPFNPATEIRFEVPVSGFVSLRVYDVLGREIATLVHEQKSPGIYTAQWEASGRTSGVYYYRLITVNRIETKSMVVMK